MNQNRSQSVTRFATRSALRTSTPSYERPLTAMRSAGYSSKYAGGSATFSKSHITSAQKPTNQASLLEVKIKATEKEILNYIDKSYALERDGNCKLALDAAKEASSKEQGLIRLLDQSGLNDAHNLDLTFMALITVAHHYVSNGMYAEALNIYHSITKKKIFRNSFYMKINVGNIYARMGQYQKAIKIYKWTLDHIPNTNQDLRNKVAHNIGVIFVKMRCFNEAAFNFEYIMREKASSKAAFHYLICNVLVNNKEVLPSAFETLLNIPYDVASVSERPLINDDTNRQLVIDTLLSDNLSVYENKMREDIKRYVLISADLVAHSVGEDYLTEYNRLVEIVKLSSNYEWLVGYMELNKVAAFIRVGETAKAIETLKFVEQLGDQVGIIAATNLSFIYLAQGDLEQAENSLKMESYKNEAYVNAGNCAFLKGDFTKAAKLYNTVLENDSTCIEASYNLGLLNKRTNKLYEALDIFLKLNSILMDDVDILYQVAHLYELTGNNDLAIEWFQMLLTILPADYGTLEHLGALYDRMNDKQQAFHYYTESFRNNPSNLTVLDWLAAYYLELHVPEKAVHYFRKASDAQPKQAKWRLLIAACHRRAADYTAALAEYLKISDDFPENLDCLKSLVSIAQKLGLKEVAEYSERLKLAEDRIRKKLSSVKSGKNRAFSASSVSSAESGSISNNAAVLALGKNQSTIDASYDDPLGAPAERPKTSTKRNKLDLEEQFGNEEISNDLLPE